jgi:hypothetical protein
MLQRAKRLQPYFDRYCRLESLDNLQLDSDEWRQLEYLLCLTKPFFLYTTTFSKTKDVTIHHVFKLYNELFKHIEASIRQLRKKKVCFLLIPSRFALNLPLLHLYFGLNNCLRLTQVGWKKQMLAALEVGERKLREYYAKTDKPEAGNVYAHSTILAPKHKLQYFRRSEWAGGPEGSSKSWANHYHDTLQDRIETYQSDNALSLTPQSFPQASEIDRMLDDENEADLDQDELTRYLQASKPTPFHLAFT